MPRKSLTQCSKAGCDQLYEIGGRCPVHYVAWEGSTRKARLPRGWAAKRSRVLRRDAHTCYLCGSPATEVDHIVAGDNHHESNLAAICTPCHRRKSAREGVEARRRRRG